MMAQKPNFRCIIFVRTRPVANALLSYLAEETRLLTFNLNAKLLTGANAKVEKLGKFVFFNRHSFCSVLPISRLPICC